MKKTLAFAAIFLLTAAAGFSQKFSLRLGAGMGTASGGDISDGIKGLSDYLADEYGATASFGTPGFGLNFAAELIYRLKPKLGVGFGLGYFSAGKESEVAYAMSTGTAVTQTLHPRIGVIPVTATFHYYPSAPASRIQLDCGAGFGLYLAHLNHDETINISIPGGNGSIAYTYASGGRMGLGLHFGVSAEYALTGRLALVAGLAGRFASVKLSTGAWTEEGSGIVGAYTDEGDDHTPWYFDWTTGGTTYPQVIFGATMPAGSDVANAREAKLGLTGFLFSVGVRINL